MHDWMALANCRDSDPEDFFDSTPHGAASAIRRYCRGCLVKAECLQYADRIEVGPYGFPYGVYGGMSGDKRRRMRAGAARTVA